MASTALARAAEEAKARAAEHDRQRAEKARAALARHQVRHLPSPQSPPHHTRLALAASATTISSHFDTWTELNACCPIRPTGGDASPREQREGHGKRLTGEIHSQGGSSTIPTHRVPFAFVPRSRTLSDIDRAVASASIHPSGPALQICI